MESQLSDFARQQSHRSLETLEEVALAYDLRSVLTAAAVVTYDGNAGSGMGLIEQD